MKPSSSLFNTVRIIIEHLLQTNLVWTEGVAILSWSLVYWWRKCCTNPCNFLRIATHECQESTYTSVWEAQVKATNHQTISSWSRLTFSPVSSTAGSWGSSSEENSRISLTISVSLYVGFCKVINAYRVSGCLPLWMSKLLEVEGSSKSSSMSDKCCWMVIGHRHQDCRPVKIK